MEGNEEREVPMRPAALAVKRRTNKITILNIQNEVDHMKTIRAKYHMKLAWSRRSFNNRQLILCESFRIFAEIYFHL